MGVWKIKQNDTSPPFAVMLRDADDIAVVLTGATVLFHMRNISESVLKVDSGVMTGPGGGALDGTGQAEYPWQAGDTDVAGLFLTEYEVTFPDGTVQTFPTTGYDKVKIFGDLDTT